MPQRRKQDHEAAATDLFTGGPMVRVVIFCAIAFFLATVTALILRATGGLANSRALIPGTPLTVATVLLPTVTCSPRRLRICSPGRSPARGGMACHSSRASIEAGVGFGLARGWAQPS